MKENQTIEDVKFWRRKRYIITILTFFGFFNVFAMRINLSVTIVAMTEEFDWDPTVKGNILGAFFYGYVTTQLIGGFLGFRYGGNLIFGLAIAVTAIFTILTPLAAKENFYYLIAVRVIMGIFEGVTFPCIYDVYSNWVVKDERSRTAGFAIAGNYMGSVFGLFLSGIITTVYGWEKVFYIFGIAGLVWTALWLIIVKRSPRDDKWISEAERNFILVNTERDSEHYKIPNWREIPWKSIFKSAPVWAIVIAHFCESWGFFTMFIELPTFMNEMLEFDLAQTGFIAAIPYLALCILVFVSGYLADVLQVKKIWTTTQVRRNFNCASFLGQMILMLAAAFVLHKVYTVVLLTCAVGIGAFSLSGFAVNHLDIAPHYAQILFGITNTFGVIPGGISPNLTQFLVKNNTKEEWQIVFYIAAGFYLIGSVFYWFFASGEPQKWASTKKNSENSLSTEL